MTSGWPNLLCNERGWLHIYFFVWNEHRRLFLQKWDYRNWWAWMNINFCASGLWVVLHTRQGESQRCPDLVMPLRYYEEPKWNTRASLEKILSVGAASKPVNTTNLASLYNLCTRGNVGNPVNTLIQHTIHFEKTTLFSIGTVVTNISYVAKLRVPFDSAC